MISTAASPSGCRPGSPSGDHRGAASLLGTWSRFGSRSADARQPRRRAASRQIRVDLRRLDALMKQVGELVVAKNRLGALSRRVGRSGARWK